MQLVKAGFSWLVLAVAAGAAVPTEPPAGPLRQVPTALDLPLMQQVTRNITDNQAISPFVMSSLMTQLYVGARGLTRDEMAPVLGLENAGTGVGQLDFLGGYSAVTDYLNSTNSSVTTGVFNRIYIRNGLSVNPSFSQTLEDGYGAGAQIFDSTPEAVTEINTAVANITHDRIPELVTEELVGQSPLVLVSAIYFKAAWKYPFPHTVKADFLTADGESGREMQVDMMVQKPLYMLYAKLSGFEALSVPYTDPDYSMLVLRPSERSVTAVQELRDSLSSLNLTKVMEQLKNKRVLLRMPRFKIETEYNLPQELSELGIKRIFGAADFSGISEDGGLFVSDIIHKVFMEVTEEGTEAAGAGAVTFGRMGRRPVDFVLDRPFFAIVYNTQHQINLFTAYVAAPSSGEKVM